MASDLIKVCVFGLTEKNRLDLIRSPDFGKTHARGFEMQGYETDADLAQVLATIRPQVIITFGEASSFKKLNACPIEVRKRWVHFDNVNTEPLKVGKAIMYTWVLNATSDRFPKQSLVSVFTPTYKTGDKIQRPWKSLLAQTYPNWEWVIYDDSPDEGATFRQLHELSKQDARVHVFKAAQPCGVIGEVKRRVCGLCRGSILVELDHDDELTSDCLQMIVRAFGRYPEAGFAYTDFAETHDDGRQVSYADGWGFGFGYYRREMYNGLAYMVASTPNINSKTMRHIVGVPNHVRAWRASTYHEIGGHSPDIHVADDYEILVRTFLKTRMVHIRALGYIQYYNAEIGNTQLKRNAEIQRLVRYIAHVYLEPIHERLLELGVADFIWRPGNRLNWDTPNPTPPQDCELVFDPYPATAGAASR